MCKYAIPKAVVALGSMSVAAPSYAAGVEVMPLGSHAGEFCRFDRAMAFEDPDGTRILYDGGRSGQGGDDPRLGKIDAMTRYSFDQGLSEHRLPAVDLFAPSTFGVSKI